MVAAKTLARFRQLDDRDFAEYYLLGTLASVAVAIVSGLIARAALSVARLTGREPAASCLLAPPPRGRRARRQRRCPPGQASTAGRRLP